MSEKKYIIPEGMLSQGRAAYSAYVTAEEGARRIIKAVLRWQSENPQVPTSDEARRLIAESVHDDTELLCREFTEAWQRRMFLASEPEVPEAIADLLTYSDFPGWWKHAVIEAYRRGYWKGSTWKI